MIAHLIHVQSKSRSRDDWLVCLLTIYYMLTFTAMGIKGLTALISEHAPKAIRVRCFAWILLVLFWHTIQLHHLSIGARHQAPVWLQSHHQHVHIHLPISHRCPSKRWWNADEQSRGDVKVRNNNTFSIPFHALIHTASHLMGFFYCMIQIVENGIKLAYVFDGKPPELKASVVCAFCPLSFRSNQLIVAAGKMVWKARRGKGRRGRG